MAKTSKKKEEVWKILELVFVRIIKKEMKTLNFLLSEERIKELGRHPRHKLIDIAYNRINTERLGTKYKPISKKALAIKTSHLSLEDFGYLIKSCQQKGNFSRLFFGLLKVKKHND